VGTRTINVGTREQHQLGDSVLGDVLEDLLKSGDVPGVVLRRVHTGVVHHAEVNDRGYRSSAKNVAGLLSANVDLVVLDVLRAAFERATIDPDDPRFAVE